MRRARRGARPTDSPHQVLPVVMHRTRDPAAVHGTARHALARHSRQPASTSPRCRSPAADASAAYADAAHRCRSRHVD
ncbi:hypothetical protein ACFSC4_30135 [Deinococcus malanensis]|uniref:hypothetical protein n=1 Tax=Deinococcus malanensis TaxID=1706855 RepID=UPI003645B867